MPDINRNLRDPRSEIRGLEFVARVNQVSEIVADTQLHGGALGPTQAQRCLGDRLEDCFEVRW